MRLILHILKKDLRRHWPEILISLGLLGLYAWVTIQGPNNRFVGARFLWFQISAETVPPLMIFFWIFLTVRVVQGETLVGDRQWWVTKPYEWWTLLAAKELFLVVSLGLPLFFVQLYLMRHAGFSVFRNLLGILTMQFELGFVLFVPSVALGSLTRGMGQALIGIIVALVGLWATFTLLEKVPSSGMSSAVDGSGEITGTLVLVAPIGAVIWQYARRRTWAARGLLASGVGAVVLITAVTPYARFVERKYPLVEASEAPAHFSIARVKLSPKKQNVRWQIELALTEYEADKARDLLLKEGEFSEPQLGICNLNEKLFSQIDCRRPFQTPALVATFDPAGAKCGTDEDPEDLPEDRVSHAWFTPHRNNSPDAGLNPVNNYQITFGYRRPFYFSAEKRQFKTVHLCPGAVIKLADPQEKRHVRIKLDMDNVRLRDLVETGFDW